MIPDFELDSYGRKVFPVKSYLIREDLAVRVDLKTLVALAAEHNAPHFVIRDVNGDGGNQDIVKRVWGLHFTHIPSAGLVIAYVPPSGEEGEAATKLAGTELEVRTEIPPSDSVASFSHLRPLQRVSGSVLRSLTEG